MNNSYILFGAGACGRYTLKAMRDKGIEPLAFADNYPNGKVEIDGIHIFSPDMCARMFPNAIFVCTVISAPAREIRKQIRDMGVRTIPLYEVLPCFHGLPPARAYETLSTLCADIASWNVLKDQWDFRQHPDYDKQPLPSSCADIYFPDFIKHLDSEVFWDCGACGGDTVELFRANWSKFRQILAIEPDAFSFSKLKTTVSHVVGDILVSCSAVGDHNGLIPFMANGDFSSHIERYDSTGIGRNAVIKKLDDIKRGWSENAQEWVIVEPPTYIKMDIEGSELEAIWGARKLIKERSPVLAVCAYHKSEDLWAIPLLIHALNPDYKLYLRRYAEGAWELIYYAVPPDRINY